MVLDKVLNILVQTFYIWNHLGSQIFITRFNKVNTKEKK
jgi:hypothetical protein